MSIEELRLTLISHDLCPYVQRAAISLAEKQVPFTQVYIDLSDKPDWFQAISPLGRVPVLLVQAEGQSRAIFESSVILEYLEETLPHPLHPENPLERALHRSWIEFGSAILNNISRLYNATDLASFEEASDVLIGQFARLNDELRDRNASPFFDSEAFSLVDAVFAPVFRYLDVFEQHASVHLCNGFESIADWRIHTTVRTSVIEAVSENYPELLRNFLVHRKTHISDLISR